MQVTVRFFASLRESTGTTRCEMNISAGSRLVDLIEHLTEQYPALQDHVASWHFAVNQVHAEPDTLLKDGDRVAVFPYIAGG